MDFVDAGREFALEQLGGSFVDAVEVPGLVESNSWEHKDLVVLALADGIDIVVAEVQNVFVVVVVAGRRLDHS